ncbi:hypothetical protein [Streptomyces sp. NRRL F-2580]|uniref:hypothetical protein n=1 Tax=Streptomyces sp. NRRL F-2580 TaxID=1463841 RepID=UPI0004C8F533|nr:hypothetical protein [Streptomyces sp. NRRL F-2580]
MTASVTVRARSLLAGAAVAGLLSGGATLAATGTAIAASTPASVATAVNSGDHDRQEHRDGKDHRSDRCAWIKGHWSKTWVKGHYEKKWPHGTWHPGHWDHRGHWHPGWYSHGWSHDHWVPGHHNTHWVPGHWNCHNKW